MLDHHHRDVVQFHAVRHGQHRAVPGADRGRQVVDHPVGAVLDAGFGQQVGRVQGLGQAGSKPAHRIVPAGLPQRGDGVADHGALVLDQMGGHLVVAVHHELPPRIAAGFCHLRIGRGNDAVDRQGRRDAVQVERRLQPPEADPHAVFVPRPVGQVGDHRGALRRAQHLARHGAVDVPALDVHHQEDGDALAVRQRQPGGGRWRPGSPGAGRVFAGRS